MNLPRRTIAATGMAAVLAAAGVSGAVAANQTDAPPKIAFLANGHVAADALAAGPIAGQLGAPMYTTAQDNLSSDAADALKAYGPELVIVLGGPVAVSDEVIDQVEAATGLSETDAATPDGGVIRAAGGDRFETATVVAGLLSAYNPAFVTAGGPLDADTLDGKDATAFLPADGKAQSAAHADTATTATTAGDADTLSGKSADEFADASSALRPVAVFHVHPAGGIVAEEHRAPATGAPTSVRRADNRYDITIPGVNFDIFEDAVTCSPVNWVDVNLTVDSDSGAVTVKAWDQAGDSTTTRFSCVVYDID